jgi:transposase-like protein
VSNQKLKNRREFSAQQKAQIAIELIRGDKTLAQMSAEHQIKVSVLSRWKQEFLERSPQLFLRAGNSEQEIKMLEMQGQLERQAQDLAILKKALLLWEELKERDS